MLTLYGSLQSRANRCAWMLKELGVDFESAPISFLDGSTRAPAFLEINPNGRVPALDHDGFRVFESLAINLYLARKFGGPLAPTSEEEDALAVQWSFWVVTEIEKPMIMASANLKLLEPGERSPEELQIAVKKLSRPFHVLERHFASRPYLLGDRFTVADLNVAAVLTLAVTVGLDFEAWPRLKAWLHGCLYRPAATDWRTVDFRIKRAPGDLSAVAMFV